jgi:hypothetical protein
MVAHPECLAFPNPHPSSHEELHDRPEQSSQCRHVRGELVRLQVPDPVLRPEPLDARSLVDPALSEGERREYRYRSEVVVHRLLRGTGRESGCLELLDPVCGQDIGDGRVIASPGRPSTPLSLCQPKKPHHVAMYVRSETQSRLGQTASRGIGDRSTVGPRAGVGLRYC